MVSKLNMIKFIFTISSIMLISMNKSSTEAIKFEDDPIKNPTSAIIDEKETNLETMENLDDVDARILTGTRHVRRKKHYAHSASENNVKKINDNHSGSIHDKSISTHGNGQNSGEAYENTESDDSRFGGSDERFGSSANGASSNGFRTSAFPQTNTNHKDDSFDGESFQVSNEEGFHGINNGASTVNGFHGNKNGASNKDGFIGIINGASNEDSFRGSKRGVSHEDNIQGSNDDGASSVIEQCVRDDSVGILPCISQKTVSFLERYSHNARDINIEENLILSSNPEEEHQSSRLIPLGEDPTDYRTGLEAVSTFLQRRTIRYHLQAVYPGLFLVVNPSYQGKGIIEFQLDPRSSLDERQLSTARLLIKRNVLPLLLGFKISIISIIPIVFAIIFFLTKKAMILSKLALLVTSFVGFSSIAKILSHGVRGGHHLHHSHHHHGTGYTAGYTGGGSYSGGGFAGPGGFSQGHGFEDSILSAGSLLGLVDDGFGYRKPGSTESGSGGTGSSGGFGNSGGSDYSPEPELIFHKPGFKKESADRSGKRVVWKRT